jgi:hypothetical protein
MLHVQAKANGLEITKVTITVPLPTRMSGEEKIGLIPSALSSSILLSIIYSITYSDTCRIRKIDLGTFSRRLPLKRKTREP